MRQRIITETAEHISDTGVKRSNVKLQPPGTVLLSFKLTIGRVAVAGIPLYTNEAIAGLRPTGLLPEYLYHGIQHWDLLQGVDQAIKGATLNKEKLKRITFQYPENEPEQTKIAEVLSTVDRAIEQTEALIAKQQRMKTGLMQDLLTRGIDEHGNLRSEQTHQFKDSPLGRIPAEWEAKPLREVIASITDYRGMTPPYVAEGIAAISAENIGGGKVKSITKWVSPATYKRTTTRGFPEAGDTIFTTEAPVAEVAWLPGDQIYRLTRRLIALRPKATVRKRFLYWSVFYLSEVGAWESKMHGSTVPRILKPDILAQPLTIPLVAEQDIIVSCLDSQENRVENGAAHLGKLRSLKTALMQDLLTGETRVTTLLETL